MSSSLTPSFNIDISIGRKINLRVKLFWAKPLFLGCSHILTIFFIFVVKKHVAPLLWWISLTSGRKQIKLLANDRFWEHFREHYWTKSKKISSQKFWANKQVIYRLVKMLFDLTRNLCFFWKQEKGNSWNFAQKYCHRI